MMFKKISTVVFLYFLLLIPMARLAYAEPIKLEPADILLVYDDNLSDVAGKNVQILIECLSYQNYSVAYGSVEECEDSLQQYKHIIAYDLDERKEHFVNALGRSDSSVMFIGNNSVKAYCLQKNLNITNEETKSNMAHLAYNFSNQSQFKAIVQVKKMCILSGDMTYSSGQITMDSKEQGFCIGNNTFRYIPTIDFQNALVKAAITKELAQWMWPYNGEPHSYAQYIVLDKLYPFSDLNKIIELVDSMKKLNLPFVISVMPIYQNADFPAMKRFCEVLRYAQANGGAIVLHTPINYTTIDVAQMQPYITKAMEAYIKYQVYPMGIQAPSNWLFDKQGQALLRLYSTVLIEQNENSGVNLTTNFNEIAKDGHQLIAPVIGLDEYGGSYVKVYSSAIYLDISESMDTLEKRILTYNASIVPLKSFWEISHSVYTNSSVLKYENNQLTINGQKVDVVYKPFEYEENFNYKRNLLDRITVDLANQNRKLVAVVAVVLVLFVMFILIARYENKKKFFYPKER